MASKGILKAALDAVRRGAALLDAKQPGWAKRIDPMTLDLQSCNQCVLGQLYRRNRRDDGFGRGLDTLKLSGAKAKAHGFDDRARYDNWTGEEKGVTYEQLDKAWLFEIGRRVNGRIRGA